MADLIKVHLYSVINNHPTPLLETLLTTMQNTQLQNRLRMVGRNEVRIESILPPNSQENNSPYWLLDFTKLRFDHGPGKASRTQAIEGFQLANNEGFGEETAALYDPQYKFLLVQYNHHGVRAGSIQDYFVKFDDAVFNNYELLMQMDETSEIRLSQKRIIKKVSFKIAPVRMTAAQRRAGVSLERSLAIGEPLNAETIEITVSAGKSAGSSLTYRRASQLIQSLKNLLPRVEDDPVVLDKFEVHGKTHDSEAVDAINMIAPKLELEIGGLVMGDDRRYTQRSRWDALIRARRGWRGVIEQ